MRCPGRSSARNVLDMKDLKEGMVLKGTVRNVIDFGAFVDIGVHQAATGAHLPDDREVSSGIHWKR